MTYKELINELLQCPVELLNEEIEIFDYDVDDFLALENLSLCIGDSSPIHLTIN